MQKTLKNTFFNVFFMFLGNFALDDFEHLIFQITKSERGQLIPRQIYTTKT